MTNGKAVGMRLRGTDRGGIPWITILDAEGEELITSDGPKGNIGCPVTPDERSHFMTMVKKTAQKMSEKDIAVVKAKLDDFAEKILRKRK